MLAIIPLAKCFVLFIEKIFAINNNQPTPEILLDNVYGCATAKETSALFSTKVRFEDILKLVGDEGRWQITIFMFTWIEGILMGFHHLSSSFLGASMDHWCNVDNLSELNSDWTDEQKKNFTIPM